MNREDYSEEDESKDTTAHLIEHRLPWLTFGLLGGMLASVVMSHYEAVLSSNLQLAFFIPIIVYMSDALGTQTETILIRTMAKKNVRYTPYIIKETISGVALGIIFGLMLGLFAFLWLHSMEVALTVGIAMFVNLSMAPLLAVTIPRILYREHFDPALGAGPVATIIQDLISLLVYFFIATVIIFH